MPSRWSFEAVLIIVSVGLGYAAARYEEYRSNRDLADRALVALSNELEYNRSQLEPMVPLHAAWVSSLENVRRSDPAAQDRSAIDVFFATRPELPLSSESPFPLLQRSAWDAALSSGALRLIDYDLAAVLSDVYRMQETATDNVDRLAKGALSEVATYDPMRRPAAVRLLWLTLSDILAAEIALLELYGQHLPAVEAVARRRPEVSPPT